MKNVSFSHITYFLGPLFLLRCLKQFVPYIRWVSQVISTYLYKSKVSNLKYGTSIPSPFSVVRTPDACIHISFVSFSITIKNKVIFDSYDTKLCYVFYFTPIIIVLIKNTQYLGFQTHNIKVINNNFNH